MCERGVQWRIVLVGNTIGEFSPNTRSESCLRCDNVGGNYYQEQKGRTTCVQCPAKTTRVVGSSGANKSKCMCQPSKAAILGVLVSFGQLSECSSLSRKCLTFDLVWVCLL
jgi:hypothetical protein